VLPSSAPEHRRFIGRLDDTFNESRTDETVRLCTLKRGFSLHHGLSGCGFLGEYRTVERFPMVIAGPWFAPMMFNEPGVGHQVLGELYDVDEPGLVRIDSMESIGQPGNLRVLIDVSPTNESTSSRAFAYMKSRALADPIHSEYLSSYQDHRFIPPERHSP
jgi:gamma-glutamylaminecyclotransferase